MTRSRWKQLGWIVFTLLVAGVITWFSSQTGDESAEESWALARRVRPVLRLEDVADVVYLLNLVLRKIAHFLLFAALGWGLWNSLRFQKRLPTLPAAAVSGSLFGALDELHQSFVPNRVATFHDILIDACGVVAGAVAALYFLRWITKSGGCKAKAAAKPEPRGGPDAK